MNTRPMYWSVRRELWENRSIYIAPLAVAAFVLLGFLIHAMLPPHDMSGAPSNDPAKQLEMAAMLYSFAAILLILTSFVVGVFYCLDALHSERRDRSILFWKSLPVSDLTTVLSKVSIPLVVLPLLIFAITLATQLIMLLLNTAVLLGDASAVVTLWSRVPLFEMSLVLLYGLTVHALWYAPIYGWLLLVSAWARRATFLWAVLPLLAPAAVEKMALNTSYWGSVLKYRLNGGMAEAFVVKGQSSVPIVRLSQLDPVKFLSSPGLWIGLAFAAAFLAAAVRLRRFREPI